MRKLFLVLFFIVSLALAVTLEKAVEGDNVMNEGGLLSVSITLSNDKSVKLLSLSDPVPDSFEPKNFPSSCKFADGKLDCAYDIKTDNFALTYQLSAKTAGKSIRIAGATMRYVNPDTEVEEAIVSNDIDKLFFIGLPEIELNITNFQADGKASEGDILPNADASFVLQVKNSGSIDAENISIEISSALFSEKKQIAVLRPGASTSFKVSAKAPAIGGFTEIESTINVISQWTDVGGRSYVPAQALHDFRFIRPKLSVTRDIGVRWKKEEALRPFVDISLEIENEGEAPAEFSVTQQLPKVQGLPIPKDGSVEKDNWKADGEIGPKAKKTVSISLPVEMGQLTVPALSLSYEDSRGNDYEEIGVSPEDISVERTIWAMIYKAIVEPLGDKVLLEAAVMLMVSLLLLTRIRNPPMIVALAAVALLSALIIYTWYTI